jgi:hypothetical protein
LTPSLPRPQSLASNSQAEDDDDDVAVIEDLHLGRRRPQLTHDQSDDDYISDYVRFRLALARALSMEAYYSKYS